MHVSALTDHPLLNTGVSRITEDVRSRVDAEWSLLCRGDAGPRPDVTPGLGDLSPGQVALWVERQDPDCLLLVGDPGSFSGIAECARRVNRVCPVVYYHVWDNEPAPTWNIRLYSMCDHIACASELTYTVVRDVGPNAEISHVPHGVDLDVFTPPDRGVLAGHDGPPTVLYVGANQARKNVPVLVHAFAEAAASDPAMSDARLVLRTEPRTGSALRRQARYLGVEDMLTLTGPMSDPDLAALYGSATVVVNPAYREGFGLTTLEAAACGTLRLSADTGGLSDQIDSLSGHSAVESSRSVTSGPRVAEIREDRVRITDLADRIAATATGGAPPQDDRQEIRDARMSASAMAGGIERIIRASIDGYTEPRTYHITRL